LNPAQD